MCACLQVHLFVDVDLSTAASRQLTCRAEGTHGRVSEAQSVCLWFYWNHWLSLFEDRRFYRWRNRGSACFSFPVRKGLIGDLDYGTREYTLRDRREKEQWSVWEQILTSLRKITQKVTLCLHQKMTQVFSNAPSSLKWVCNSLTFCSFSKEKQNSPLLSDCQRDRRSYFIELTILKNVRISIEMPVFYTATWLFLQLPFETFYNPYYGKKINHDWLLENRNTILIGITGSNRH